MKIPLTLQHSLPNTQQNIIDFGAKKTTKIAKEILTCIFKQVWKHNCAITSCMHGIAFDLNSSPQYTKCFKQLLHNLSPIISKFDMDLVSFHNLLFKAQWPSPTTHATFYNFSQPAQPSCSSNPSLMDQNNLPLLPLDTNTLLTPTRGRRRHQESPESSSLPLPPSSSALHQCPHTHTWASHFHDGFFFAQIEHFCPLFAQIAQMGSLFAQISTANPCSLLRRHTPLSGMCTYISRALPPAERPRESCSANAAVR